MKAKFGAIVVDGRGKLGGHVFSKNAAGAYMRTKVTPTNPQTSYQSAARALFAAISQAWSGLSDAVRTAWNEAVTEWQKTDVFGDLKKPTGKALFQRLNNQAQSAGWSAVTTVPARAELPDAVITAASIDITNEEIILTGKDTASTTRIMLFATPPLSQGTTFVKNKLRNFYNTVADTFPDTAAYTPYVNRFGAPSDGDNIYIGVKYVLANGQASPLQIIKATVTEP